MNGLLNGVMACNWYASL